MKRLILIVLSLVFCLSAFACAENDDISNIESSASENESIDTSNDISDNTSDASDVSDTDNTMLMTIAETIMGAKPFEDHKCFYAHGSDGVLYRVFWTDFIGLAEKMPVKVEYSKIEETPNYDPTVVGGYNPKYEMTAASVEILPDETEKLEYQGYVFDGVVGEGIDGVNKELSDKDALSIYAIRTQDDLDEFLEIWKPSAIYVDADGEFSDYVDRLDDGFFEENAMIAVPVVHSCTPAYYSFVGVERRRDEIILSISYDVSKAMDTAIQQNTLVAVVKKSDIEGCDSYSVVPIDAGDEISYSDMSWARKSIGQDQIAISKDDAEYLLDLINNGDWTNGTEVCIQYDWYFPSDVFYDSLCGIFVDMVHKKVLILDENERDAVNKILSGENEKNDDNHEESLEGVIMAYTDSGPADRYADITDKESEWIRSLLEGAWEDGIPDCDTDWVFTVGNKTLFYHSYCGKFVDRQNQRALSLSDSEQARLNGILSFDESLAELRFDEIIEINVSSLPKGYDYSFRSSDQNGTAKDIIDYLASLDLKSEFPENPDEYGGMTWVITLIYEDNSTLNIYHSGNMFIRIDSGEWYRMAHEDAVRLDDMLRNQEQDE